MENQENKIKMYKLYLLQKKYTELSDIIYKLSEHINYIDSLYLIELNRKNILLSNLFEINKNINTIYNNYIIKNIDKNIKFQSEIDLLISSVKNFEHIDNFIDLIDEKNMPFNNELNVIKSIIKDVGYYNLESLFNLFFDKTYKKKYSYNFTILFNEINNVFIPLSINIYKMDIETDYEFYWRIPKIFNEEDILQSTRELWIRDEVNQYIKIEGIFKNDILSNCLKTCQIINPYLYFKKNNIIKNVKNVDINFIKKFIRYNYIGNIYCMKIEEYIEYLTNSYSLYLQLTKTSFINIMKNFISNGSKLNKLYDIILLLLLGNDDNANIAGLLLDITKEKKINAPKIYNLINNNLSFFLQLKLKKSNSVIKTELDKIKTITVQDIDYKKQLISMKNIPNNIKAITLEKIEEMKSHNNEYYKQKTFVETILKYPWSINSIVKSNNEISNPMDYLNNIKNKLTNLTYGHEEAKNMLLQTIANWISNPKSGGRPLGFVGPPGVGKTLLAKSISKALDIPFSEITLGGQNDGELLHGHGYTYSGSQPGLIVKKMVEMGKERCILYFDELDKTTSKHGQINEIMSILIHITDPNMNKSFQDRFFQGVDFPLDKVIMIFSYNDSDKIDPILLDRITEIKINPYTINDKIEIVKNYIIPELKENIGIDIAKQFNNDNIEYIIDNYTNEAGIRNIKRKIEKIFLTINLEILTNKINKDTYTLNTSEINRILLKPLSDITKIHSEPSVGIINGLYATSNGDGGIIPIQIFNNHSTNNNFDIKLTGKQGDVMKESVQCSLTVAIRYIKNNLTKYNIDNFDLYFNDKFKSGFHVHCPAAAIPKDGPSAGCAFTSCFISCILNKPIKNDIAMTGEIELNGKITKIGGLMYKLIGAKKAGIKLTFISKENNDDLKEIIEKYPNLINNEFNVKTVNYIDELIDQILI